MWANSYAETANQISAAPFSGKLKCLRLWDLTVSAPEPSLSGFEYMLFPVVYFLHGLSFAAFVFLYPTGTR